MADERYKRKLTAILGADVKGYSRLMDDDEEATLRTLSSHRTVFTNLIEEYGGRVVDTPGDYVLAEFPSVVDSVKCAVEIQRELAERNEELSDDRKMEFRIGINLGDVIEKDGKIYGDGVNIAARMEPLADAGGICISGRVYDQIANKLDVEYEYLGEHEVKNISIPIRVYKVLSHPGAIPHRVVTAKQTLKRKSRRNLFAVIAMVIIAIVVVGAWQYFKQDSSVGGNSSNKAALSIPDKPSIAVLPFENMSGNPKQDYFCDGLTEDLITALSKISDVFVIARNSVFIYKGKQVSVKQVAEELGVRYVLEGSVRTIDQKVRITIQLVDSKKADPLWAERYDRNMEDIFALQDEITMQVLTALQVKLTEGEKIRALTRSTNDINAYLKWAEGRQHFLLLNREDNIMARPLLEEAIALDPEFSSPYVDLAWTCLVDIRFGISESPKESLAEATRLAKKAISLDESSPFGHCVLGAIFTTKRQYDKAIEQGQKAIALSPGDSLAMAHLGRALSYAGKYEESLPWMKKAIRQDPKALNWYSNVVGHDYLFMGRYQEALKVLKEAHENNPKDMTNRLRLVAAYYLSGQEVEARAEAEKIMEQNPDFSTTKRISAWPMKNKSDSDLFIDVLRKAGLPE